MSTEYEALKKACEEIAGNKFEQIGEDHYRLTVPDFRSVFDLNRIRRERNSLIGELLVKCGIDGIPTVDGVLSVAEFNVSSQRAREDRARYLLRRSRTSEIDWLGLVEELAQRVLAAERHGAPSVDLRDVPKPKPDDVLEVNGLTLPRRHPSILFGDGGAAKSYIGLYFIGQLALRGARVGLFDWELAGEDHRDRLERLFPGKMPEVQYARCERPLVSEIDRLRRIVMEHRLHYVVLDSVAFACDGPPEAAEIAGRYFRASREFRCGSLHIAHVSKAEGADQKPFGSTFWHNGARSTWYVKLAESSPDGHRIQVGLYNRKSNLGSIRRAVGYEIDFEGDFTQFSRISLTDVPDLADKLSIRQRMEAELKSGAMSSETLADTIGARPDSVRRTAARHRDRFVLLDGGFVGLSR